MSKRIKILHLISSLDGNWAGRELAQLVDRLPTDEFESEVGVLSVLGLRSLFSVGTYFSLRRLMKRFRPDIIHTWDETANFYGRAAALHCRRPFIVTEKRSEEIAKNWFQKFLDQKTDRFIVSRKTDLFPESKSEIVPLAAVPMKQYNPIPANELLDRYGFPMVEPVGDYYPVFLPQYEPALRNYRSIPASDPRRQKTYLIGIVCPLRSEHRILDALWVFETLNHVHLNFHVFIIGDGKDREQLLRYRDRWKLFSRVHFVGNRQDVDRLLPSFDILLHLSNAANQTGSILSAMSCGVPVIAVETPESKVIIEDGVSGILIPDKDSLFLRRTAAKKTLFLLENEELRRSIKASAKERIAEHFDFNVAVHVMIEMYRKIGTFIADFHKKDVTINGYGGN